MKLPTLKVYKINIISGRKSIKGIFGFNNLAFISFISLKSRKMVIIKIMIVVNSKEERPSCNWEIQF